MSLSDDLNSAIISADVEQNLINTVPELREFIHFDTLWQMASLIVLEHGHLEWTDTAEHDPGTTLLQAATYAIADLSYRHTHPLIDLLTPGQGQPVFDPAFGPEKALTVSPVTEDDYRRGIMDLCDEDGFFMFRNAQLVRESEAERYKYFYDSENGTFTFSNNTVTIDSAPQVLLGGYRLYVEAYSWLYRPKLMAMINSYLIRHRNLGEQVRLIKDVTWNYVYLRPFIDVELDDDCQEPARVIGMIWETVTKLYAPWPRRDVEEAHLVSGGSIETLYNGPKLDNGWITQPLPDVDYTVGQSIDLRKLPLELLKIDGIKQVRRLSWDAVKVDWVKTVSKGQHLIFWHEYPDTYITGDDSTLRLFKRGQRQNLTSDEVKPYINWPTRTPHTQVTGPQGQFLGSLKDALDIPGLLPDCYGLNDDNQRDETETVERQRLKDFLSLFQQWVDNSCKELAGLSKLLSFDQPVGAIGSGYFQDYEKGLATINYLLGYFGSQRAPRVFNKTGSDSQVDDEFFESQRAALAQWAELGYGRANVPVNTVTAFNKRLAFRLGIGAKIFSETPELEKLPVYVIDYITLLPEMPNVDFVDRTVKLATLVTIDNDVKQLKLVFEGDELPVAGQLISLVVDNPKIIILWALVVRVDSNIIYLDLSNNKELSGYADQLDGLEDLITCNNSNVWLRRMDYKLDYEVVTSAGSNPRAESLYRMSVPYSVHLFKKGDTVKIDPSLIKPVEFTAEVTEVDIPHGTLLVKATTAWPAANNQVFWYRVEAEIVDRFSLKVGVVLDRDRWLKEDRPEEVMAWVAQIVREEMPAHIQADVHWLSEDEFEYFGQNYKAWQLAASESRLGQTSYELMKQLSLGQLPAPGKGIGTYHIVDPEEMSSEWYQEATEPPVSRWEDGSKEQVEAAQVVYIPRDVT